jgi:hypothetical protein
MISGKSRCECFYRLSEQRVFGTFSNNRIRIFA